MTTKERDRAAAALIREIRATCLEIHGEGIEGVWINLDQLEKAFEEGGIDAVMPAFLAEVKLRRAEPPEDSEDESL